MNYGENKIKVILTGGHMSPLLAVIGVLSKKAECVVIGRRKTFEEDDTESLEYKILQGKHIKFYDIKAGRMQRKLTRHTLPSLIKVPRAFFNARRILKKERPNAVLTFGGYIGLPVALAAYSLKIPVILHEQTQQAGQTNRLIGRFAKRICLSFPSSSVFFPKDRIVETGNPLRPEIFVVNKTIKIPGTLPVLFVTGGSSGAHSINQFIEYLLPKILEHFIVIHQTGDSQTHKDFDRLIKIKNSFESPFRERYIVEKFIMPELIGWVYKTADVVLGRSGANTVSELLALKKKAILIPLPHGQKNEQLLNAKMYEESGLGIFIEQKNVQLSSLLSELLTLEKKKVHASKILHDLSAEKITNEVLKVALT